MPRKKRTPEQIELERKQREAERKRERAREAAAARKVLIRKLLDEHRAKLANSPRGRLLRLQEKVLDAQGDIQQVQVAYRDAYGSDSQDLEEVAVCIQEIVDYVQKDLKETYPQ